MQNVDIKPILNGWISARNKLIARHSILNVTQKEYIDTLNGFANQLSLELPTMTIAEWEALSELVGTQLGLMRQREALYRRT